MSTNITVTIRHDNELGADVAVTDQGRHVLHATWADLREYWAWDEENLDADLTRARVDPAAVTGDARAALWDLIRDTVTARTEDGRWYLPGLDGDPEEYSLLVAIDERLETGAREFPEEWNLGLWTNDGLAWLAKRAGVDVDR